MDKAWQMENGHWTTEGMEKFVADEARRAEKADTLQRVYAYECECRGLYSSEAIPAKEEEARHVIREALYDELWTLDDAAFAARAAAVPADFDPMKEFNDFFGGK